MYKRTDLSWIPKPPKRIRPKHLVTLLCKACGKEKQIDKCKESYTKYCSVECAKQRFKK